VAQRSEARDVRESPFPPVRRRALPRFHLRVLAAIAVGGFAGGLLRYAVSLALPAGPRGFPWAVFEVNTTGAFVLGLVLILVLEVLPPTTYVRPLLGTGFCGALTTYSTFSYETVKLLEQRAYFYAVMNVLVSLVIGMGAALLGYALVSALVG
jgi:CrcB protein